MDCFWSHVDGDTDVLKYLPDRESMEKELDREFAYTVLNTLRPGFLTEVINHAVSLRTKVINTKLTPDTITIKDEVLEALAACPAKPVSFILFLNLFLVVG